MHTVTNVGYKLTPFVQGIVMKKYSYGLKKLKIIEQIAIVFFIAVVIPMSISGFVINNINQKSVRHQLRESAILVASMVSDEMDFLIKSNQ